MAANEKKGLTVKIDLGLHTEVRQFLESHGMTMAEFVEQALRDELHPKNNITEDKNMGNMRTMAFQVPEELFQKIKDYLQRNNMTQKQFVIGLIETEINRDLRQRAAESGQRESADVRAFEGGSEAAEGNDTEEQCESDFEDVSDGENEELDDDEAEDIDEDEGESEVENLDDEESEDINEDQDESEDQGMSMGM